MFNVKSFIQLTLEQHGFVVELWVHLYAVDQSCTVGPVTRPPTPRFLVNSKLGRENGGCL